MAQECTNERILAQSIQSVASEMRMFELEHLVDYIRSQRYSNIQDLVNSSAELYFKPGTLTFGWGANAVLHWTQSPSISLDMEFRNLNVTVFFTLQLKGFGAAVDIKHIVCDGSEQAAPVLRDALEDAQLERSRVL